MKYLSLATLWLIVNIITFLWSLDWIPMTEIRKQLKNTTSNHYLDGVIYGVVVGSMFSSIIWLIAIN